MEDEEDRFIALWIAVIKQALFDATKGASDRLNGSQGKAFLECSPQTFTRNDVIAGRKFIRGETPQLKWICTQIGLDYGETLETLRISYEAAMKKVSATLH